MNDKEDLDPGDLTVAMFTPLVGSVFSLGPADGEAVELTLLEALPAKDHRPTGSQAGRAPFSLAFGCASHPLPQGTYRLEHETLGSMVMFMSPFETYEKGHKLEAVFT